MLSRLDHLTENTMIWNKYWFYLGTHPVSEFIRLRLQN